MKIAILKERRPHETRVAASPETVKKFIQLGAEVAVETGAGADAALPDEAFKAAGASIAANAAATVSGADIVLKVQRPMLADEGADELAPFAKGQALVCQMGALTQPAFVQAMAAKGITGFAMELMPRISRAQSMDVLSSQSNLAGYRAVLDAAVHLPRAFPMMMTAAGTVPPARVFVMGAGVAGLQAIATAKRLGAIVSATDVRPATKEQVESLGGTFVAVEDEEFKQAQTAAGYAKPMSAEYQAKQAQLVAEHLPKQDVVITTALIPGRPAPRLVSDAMLRTMKSGAVIVDMAVEAGGNVEGAKHGATVIKHGVKIVGPANIPALVAEDTSKLFARNLFNFLSPLIDKDSKTLVLKMEDETVAGTLVTRDGEIVLAAVKEAVAKAPASAPAAAAAAKPARKPRATKSKGE